MNLIKTHELEIKKSRFISLLYQIDDVSDVNIILNDLKKEYKKAVHFTYAYKIDNQIKKSDDGEPKNTAGMPILNVIEHKFLNNTLIVVIRYWGGIKLGAGGLTRAYSKAASEVTK